ncbi:MAG: hypothetical protein IPF40_14910 [Actinomycetales bacterium]|uniref:Methylamine utilisation protein MauE domain-containing protein n=1 Tax=Candidatus Phosphoribacter hodrii TaxID=2953743 RepID=A0A935CGL2_9MICO|nr:hypothetical protein [Candidatus Phosphoribacter hodrii]
MSPLTLLAAPLVVAGVFLLSGVAKLGDVSDGVRGLREMGVPDVFVRDWVARAHPIAEIIIAPRAARPADALARGGRGGRSRADGGIHRAGDRRGPAGARGELQLFRPPK